MQFFFKNDDITFSSSSETESGTELRVPADRIHWSDEETEEEKMCEFVVTCFLKLNPQHG